MDFKIAAKLGYDLSRAIHVGAHKFEESVEYDAYGTKEVFWIDPFPQADPKNLPENQKFLALAIDDVSTKTIRDFKIYEATGFSSFNEVDTEGSLLRGTPSDVQRVVVDSLRNLQVEHNSSKFDTLVIDTQGSELEILKSADLGQFSEVIIETSRIPLYHNESRHSEIDRLLNEQGFHHNFNASDLIYSHGDQYYSRNKFKPLPLQVTTRIESYLRQRNWHISHQTKSSEMKFHPAGVDIEALGINPIAILSDRKLKSRNTCQVNLIAKPSRRIAC